jgi:hypothetical protein
MNRVLRAMTAVLLFELGALLLYLPWSALWDKNYFLSQLVWLRPILLHPSLRGIVSGIGILDIFVGFGYFNSRATAARVPPESNS